MADLYEIVDEIEQYEPDVDRERDERFRAKFGSPKSIDHFVTFVDYLLNSCPPECIKRDRLTQILLDLIYEQDHFSTLLCSTIESSFAADLAPANHDPLWLAKLVNLLVSLPEFFANVYGRRPPPDGLTVKTYVARLCVVLREVLIRIHQSDNNNNWRLAHIRQIIGRLCVRAYTQIVWTNLVKFLSQNSVTDDKWLQITRLILLPDCVSTRSNSPTTISTEQVISLEPIMKMLFAYSSHRRMLDRILAPRYLESIGGNSSNKIEFLLTNKFLLTFHCQPMDSNFRHFDQFLLNIFTYLYVNNRRWLHVAIDNLLDTWANSNAYKHRSYYQHFYLCRQLIIAAKLLFEHASDDDDDRSGKPPENVISKFQKIIICSAEIHLSSSQMEFRAIGLTATVYAMNAISAFRRIEIEAPKFAEIETVNRNEDCDYLKNQLAAIKLNDILNQEFITEEMDTTLPPPPPPAQPQSAKILETNKFPNVSKPAKRNIELDSDDDDEDDEDDSDLIAYDLSADIRVENDFRYVGKEIETAKPAEISESMTVQNMLLVDNSRHAPIYLQDCIDGLTQIDKPDWAEKCLRSAETIIRANDLLDEEEGVSDSNAIFTSNRPPIEYGRLNAVALQFAQILFNLDNQVAIKDFNHLRLNALIALCVAAPRIAGKYIAEQFYAPHLSIRNRLDVLTILVTACEELSSFKRRLPESRKTIENRRKEEENCKLLLSSSSSSSRFEKKYFGISYIDRSAEDDSDDDDDDDACDDANRDWRTIVSERIRANTRLLSPAGNSTIRAIQPDDSSTQNLGTSRFVPVAGYFFYPLLRDPTKQCDGVRLRLRDEDSFVLEHLLYAAGAMLSNVANYPAIRMMSQELLRFMAPFRDHDHRNVRVALIMAFQAILRSTPTFYLFGDLLNSMIEYQLWLKELTLIDTDRRCAEIAASTLNLLAKLAKQSDDQNDGGESRQKSLKQSSDQRDHTRTIQSVTTRSIDETIRLIKQTNLK